MEITVERKNPRGVYARELKKWLNYSKFYSGGELQIGRKYKVELDGDFIMSAEEVSMEERELQTVENFANHPRYLALKLAVELTKERNDVDPEKILDLANSFLKFLTP